MPYVVPQSSATASASGSNPMCEAFKTMLVARILDEKFASLYRAAERLEQIERTAASTKPDG